MSERPIVTGISPKEGPPGTRVTIRGENLGKSPNDLIGLTICGVDCLLSAEWQAPNKIIARTGPVKGRGDVVVITKSGSRGSCTVQFRSFFESIGPLKESAFWMDESHLITSNAWGRKHPAAPSLFQPDNPLGLNDEGNVKKISEDELHEYYPEGSGNLSLENFVPVWFLVENHYGASFNDLKAGLNHLKRKVSSQKEGKLSFLKANVAAVLDQLDTLCNLQESILNDKTSSASGTLLSTDTIERSILRSKEEADSLFKDVLGRRDRAEATRSALGVLQRFKFLFHLPCTLERNIQKGDYDVVINDYARAKSLFANTEVQIFRKVYQDVEQRISHFRQMLYSRLQDLPMPTEKQKKIISYLVNLETAGDPAWNCVIFQQEYLLKVLQSCKQLHLDQEFYSIENLSHSGLSKSSGKSGGYLSSTLVSRPFKDRRGSHYGRSDLLQERPPNRVLFVEELCSVTAKEFPSLWKLGQAYFAGEFHPKESLDPKLGKRFERLVSEVAQMFCELVREALLLPTADAGSNKGISSSPMCPSFTSSPTKMDKDQNWSELTQDAARLWLPHAVQQMRQFYSALVQLDPNPETLQLIQSLLFDLRLSCMKSMFNRAQEEVRNLHLRETWIINEDSKHGSITQLPLVYENSVLKTIKLVREGVLQVGNHEMQLLGNSTAEEQLISLWRELLLAFPRSLKQLAIGFIGAQTNVTPLNSSTGGIAPSAIKRHMSLTSSDCVGNIDKLTGNWESNDGNSGHVWEKMLLVILGNCNFTKQNILPRLLDSFLKHGYPNDVAVGQEAFRNFELLDKFLFDTYIEAKYDPIVGAIEQGIYAGHFDWSMCSHLYGVRPYVKEILTGIVATHAELCAVSPLLVPRAIRCMVEAVSDEIARLFSCVERFGHHGKLQAHLDLMALNLAFGGYLKESSNKSLKEALDALPVLKNPKDKELLDAELDIFKRRMKFHLLCFNVEQSGA